MGRKQVVKINRNGLLYYFVIGQLCLLFVARGVVNSRVVLWPIISPGHHSS